MNLQWPQGRRLKPWVAVALLLALGLLGFYAVLGVRFWKVHTEEQRLLAEVNRVAETPRQPAAELALVRADLETAKPKLEATRAVFQSEDRDDLVTLVVHTAREAKVNLAWVGVGERGARSESEIRYGIQPLDIRLNGSLPEIFTFLRLLHERAPTVEVAKVELASLQEGPAAMLQLFFYLSPEYAPKEKKEKK